MPLFPPARTQRSMPTPPGHRRASRRLVALLLAVVVALVPALVTAQDASPRIDAASYDAARGTLTIEASGVVAASSALVSIDGTPYTPTIEGGGGTAGGTLVIAIEASSSTAFTFAGPNSLLQDAQAAAIQIVQGLPTDVAVGLVVFGDDAALTRAPTTDHAAVVASIEGITADAYSTLFDGIARAAETLAAATAPRELAVFTYGWHFGGGAVSATQARAAVVASGATVQSFALGFDYDITFLGGIAQDSGGALHRDVSASSLATVGDALGGTSTAVRLTVAADLAAGAHTVELRTAAGVASTEVTVDATMTVAPASDGRDGTLVLRVSGAPAGAVAAVAVDGRTLASGPADAPLSLSTWDLEPGAAPLKIEIAVDGSVAATLAYEATVPPLNPELGLEAGDGDGVLASARVQRGTDATFVVLVDGAEAYNGAPDAVNVIAEAGATVKARLVGPAGATLAERVLELDAPAASTASPAGDSAGWTRYLPFAAIAALLLLAVRVVPRLRSRRASRTGTRRRRRPTAILSSRALSEDDRDDLALHYQPVFDVTGQRVQGAEALLRWDDPERGVSAARHFLTRAAALEMLPGATEWVMRTACTFARDRQLEGLTDFHITVNVTVDQVLSEGFVEAIENALDVSGLAARFLEVELTEMSVLGKRAVLAPVLDQLASLGVGASIDDFWAPGGSSEAVELPAVVAVKVDLWSNTGSAAAREQIASAVAVAKQRGLATVAKRVETVHEMSFFRTLGCDAVQGNAYGAAMPEAEFIRRIGQIDEATRLAG